MKVTALILCLAFSALNAYAQKEEKPLAGEKAERREVMTITNKMPKEDLMRTILDNMVKLVPYMTNRTRFEDPANKESIIAHLVNISLAFEHAHKLNTFKFPGFTPSLETMRSHLSHTIEAMSTNHQVFAYSRVKATTQLCMTCHEQLPEGAKLDLGLAWKNVKNEDFVDVVDMADFYYLTRNWSQAAGLYKRAINERVKEFDSQSEWDQSQSDIYCSNALKKIVMTHTMGHFDLDALKSDLSEFKDHERFSGLTRERIQYWLKEIEELKTTLPKGMVLADDNQVKSFIKEHIEKYLKDQEELGAIELRALISAGILKRYLYQNPTTKTAADILYWLARAERQVHRSYFFTMADIYLKECMIKHAKNPAAKNCYAEYENNIIFGYTGSAGINIPAEEQRELDRLKKLVFPGKSGKKKK